MVVLRVITEHTSHLTLSKTFRPHFHGIWVRVTTHLVDSLNRLNQQRKERTTSDNEHLLGSFSEDQTRSGDEVGPPRAFSGPLVRLGVVPLTVSTVRETQSQTTGCEGTLLRLGDTPEVRVVPWDEVSYRYSPHVRSTLRYPVSNYLV